MSVAYVITIDGREYSHSFASHDNDALNAACQGHPEFLEIFDSREFGEAVTAPRLRFIELSDLLCRELKAKGGKLTRFMLDDEPVPGVKTTGSINAVGLRIDGEIADVWTKPDRCILRIGLYKDERTGLLVGREERDVSHLKEIRTDTSRVVVIRKRKISVAKLVEFFERCRDAAREAKGDDVSFFWG